MVGSPVRLIVSCYWEREGDRELRVGDVVTAHEGSLSGFHREAAGSVGKLQVPGLG